LWAGEGNTEAADTVAGGMAGGAMDLVKVAARARARQAAGTVEASVEEAKGAVVTGAERAVAAMVAAVKVAVAKAEVGKAAVTV